jgi:hypothetical protein
MFDPFGMIRASRNSARKSSTEGTNQQHPGITGFVDFSAAVRLSAAFRLPMGRSSGSTHLARGPGSFAGTNGNASDNSIARYLVGLSINSVVPWSLAKAITPLRNKNPKQQDNLFEAMQHLSGTPRADHRRH